MTIPDITALEIALDNLLFDVSPTDPKPPDLTGVSISLLPTYDDDETHHLYSLKLPMSLWRLLKLHVRKGNIAHFTRQAIAEKLAPIPLNPDIDSLQDAPTDCD